MCRARFEVHVLQSDVMSSAKDIAESVPCKLARLDAIAGSLVHPTQDHTQSRFVLAQGLNVYFTSSSLSMCWLVD